MGSDRSYYAATSEFEDARKKANLKRIFASFSRKPTELLSFDEVAKRLDLTRYGRQYLADIPLDAIVGSLGRYDDFNREFRPLKDSDKHRWARVKIAFEEIGLAPIEAYKIGEVYFVIDGNHRVSVAKQLGARSIEGYVTELRAKIELTPTDNIEDVILKAEIAELLEDTLLDRVRPEVIVEPTIPGRSREIYEHISAHRYYMGIDRQKDISIEEASASWVDNVYLPVLDVIRKTKVMKEFPGRTEADLYLWLKRHQAVLREKWKWDVSEEEAARDLPDQLSPKFKHAVTRFWQGTKRWLAKRWRQLPKFPHR